MIYEELYLIASDSITEAPSETPSLQPNRFHSDRFLLDGSVSAFVGHFFCGEGNVDKQHQGTAFVRYFALSSRVTNTV